VYGFAAAAAERSLHEEKTTGMTESRQLVPYHTLPLMAEAVCLDQTGSKVERWELPMFGTDDEVGLIKRMASGLGVLDEPTRKMRAHIASFTGCDSGVPTTIDELLDAIGRGTLREPALRNGCDHPGFCVQIKTSQPRQIECMQAVHEVITARLAGQDMKHAIAKYPYASGFAERTWAWLPPSNKLSGLQTLLVERMLLPFGFFLKASHADPAFEQPCLQEVCDTVMKECYEDGGRGRQLDAQIEKLADLPKISMAYPQQVQTAGIVDPCKKELYVLCCALAHGLHTLCDCHHSTFRWIENWVHAIGTGRWKITTRKLGAESERLSHLMFGYLLGLDKWLLGVPEQFLLMDLGHIDLGFDQKSDIVRVYAYLGSERTPVKTWLAAYLWTNLMYNNGGLLWRNRHRRLLDDAVAKGVSVREWMDKQGQ